MHMTEFKELVGKIVDRLFFVVWPPWGEEEEHNIDISFGLVLKDQPNKLCVISVDKNELWMPYVTYQLIPDVKYSWQDYYPRMKMWMDANDDSLLIDTEYYDVTASDLFEEIVENTIEEVEFLNIEGNAEPFGVKLIFKNDYIVSLPNSDGNTVETKFFNKNNSIDWFKYLGNVISTKL